MKKMMTFGVVLLIFLQFSVDARKKEYQFPTYADMRAEVGKLYQEKKFEELASMLEWGFDRFPEHMAANGFNLMITYIHLNQPGKGIWIMEKALKHGIWFGKYTFENDMFAPYKKEKKFQALIKKNRQMMETAQKACKPELRVQTPQDFQPDKKYPLFIALHGGGENLEQFMPRWTSPKLKAAFIVAYPQSSQLVNMNGYNWTEDMDLSLKEIVAALNRVLEEYPVDGDRIYVGGFSSGGVAALEVILRNTFPIRGFVALCPARPEDFGADSVLQARNRGIRGTLITTEMDPRIGQQKEIIDTFRLQGLQYQFVVTPNIGHWYPEDLGDKIDQALLHIDNR
jgi:predicted esterase